MGASPAVRPTALRGTMIGVPSHVSPSSYATRGGGTSGSHRSSRDGSPSVSAVSGSASDPAPVAPGSVSGWESSVWPAVPAFVIDSPWDSSASGDSASSMGAGTDDTGTGRESRGLPAAGLATALVVVEAEGASGWLLTDVSGASDESCGVSLEQLATRKMHAHRIVRQPHDIATGPSAIEGDILINRQVGLITTPASLTRPDAMLRSNASAASGVPTG